MENRIAYIINSTRLSKSGQRVTIVRAADESGVVLVDNGEGVHSTLASNLSESPPVVEEPIIIPEPKRKKELSKLEIEYLKSIGK